MGKFKVCACCEGIVDVDGENTGKEALAFSVSLCSKITEVTSDDPSVVGSLQVDLPTVNEVKPSLTDLVVCKECEETVRSQLPVVCCSGCKIDSVVVCHEPIPTQELDSISEEVTKRWKCVSCHKQPEGMEIKWKCLKCFAKDSFCGSCKKPAENKNHLLRCAQCELTYHYFCDKIEPEKFCGMTAEKKSKWTCKTCFSNKVKGIAKEVGKHVAISAALSAVALGGIPFAVARLGFGAAGVRSLSLAAWYQSKFLGGFIARGSLFAILQSVGAAGLAVSTKAGLVGVCTALPLLGKIQWNNPTSDSSDKKKR